MDVTAVSKAASELAKKSASTDAPREEYFLPHKQWDEDIVISGISGRYPESENVDEFWNNLLHGEELASIDDRRWPVGKFAFFALSLRSSISFSLAPCLRGNFFFPHFRPLVSSASSSAPR